MKIDFYKYHGTGNDFIIIDNRENAIMLYEEQVMILCNRRFGIGADGLMLMNNHVDYDFEMIYYNADGKPGTMCGNGGRCMVQFAVDRGMSKTEYSFTATDGAHKAIMEKNGWIHLKMKDVQKVELVSPGDFIIDTGSPHYIKPVDDVESIDIVQEGRKIRYNTRFEKAGINVNFVEVFNGQDIFVRTYERGVEDETLSCGTGVTASALVFAHNLNGFNRVNVKTKGGQLAVEYYRVDGNTFHEIWLCGPATFVFKGEIEL